MSSKSPILKAVHLTQSEHVKQISKTQKEIDIVCHALSEPNPDIFHITKALQEIGLPELKNKECDIFKAEARKELVLPLAGSYNYSVTAIRKDGTRIEPKDYSKAMLSLAHEIPTNSNIVTMTDNDKSLPSGARRLLEVLVAWYPNSLTEGHWRSNAGLRKTGTFSNYKSMLITAGLIDKDGEKFIATQAGIDYFGDNRPTAPQTTAEVLALWMNKLPEGARRMLSVLIDANGEYIEESEWLQQANLNRTGTSSNYKSKLMTAKLIKKNGNTYAADKETLFL